MTDEQIEIISSAIIEVAKALNRIADTIPNKVYIVEDKQEEVDEDW